MRKEKRIINGEKLTVSFRDYTEERKKRDPRFAEGYEEGYRNFKIGVLLKLAREEVGMTQSQIARKLKTISPQSRASKNMQKIFGSRRFRNMLARWGKKLKWK